MFSPPSIAVRKDAGGCAKLIFSEKSYPTCESELPPSTEWLRSSGEAGNKGISISQAGAQASATDARGGSGVPLADLILKAWLGQGRAKGAKAGGKF